ncbi:hypothetical protein ACLUX0_08175 [Limosilactobacillus mucosae]
MEVIDKQFFSQKNFSVITIPSINVKAGQVLKDELGNTFKVSELVPNGKLVLSGKSSLIVNGEFKGNTLEIV